MTTADPLWSEPPPRLSPGRVRKGLDADIKAADGAALPQALVAALRGMADQIDALERQLRAPGVKPYDRVPLAQLQRQFDDTYGRCFGTNDDAAGDPLVDALNQWRAEQAEQRRAAAAGDAAHAEPVD